jgi:hypothetical protein
VDVKISVPLNYIAWEGSVGSGRWYLLPEISIWLADQDIEIKFGHDTVYHRSGPRTASYYAIFADDKAALAFQLRWL